MAKSLLLTKADKETFNYDMCAFIKDAMTRCNKFSLLALNAMLKRYKDASGFGAGSKHKLFWNIPHWNHCVIKNNNGNWQYVGRMLDLLHGEFMKSNFAAEEVITNVALQLVVYDPRSERSEGSYTAYQLAYNTVLRTALSREPNPDYDAVFKRAAEHDAFNALRVLLRVRPDLKKRAAEEVVARRVRLLASEANFDRTRDLKDNLLCLTKTACVASLATLLVAAPPNDPAVMLLQGWVLADLIQTFAPLEEVKRATLPADINRIMNCGWKGDRTALHHALDERRSATYTYVPSRPFRIEVLCLKQRDKREKNNLATIQYLVEKGADTASFAERDWWTTFVRDHPDDAAVVFLKTHEASRESRNLLTFLKRAHPEIADIQCAICLDTIATGLTTTNCGHPFHAACLAQIAKPECPCCRASLPSKRQRV